MSIREKRYDFSNDSFEGMTLPFEEQAPDTKTQSVRGGHDPKKNLLQLYFRDIEKIPLLSEQEFVRLAEKLEHARIRNDESATEEVRGRLISANLRLVVSIAKRFSHCGMPLLDLIQAGNMGLMKAIDRFDYRLGFKFSTYASKWIQAAISRAISNQARTIRIPANLMPLLKKVNGATRRRSAELEHSPTATEAGGPAETDELKLDFAAQIPQYPVSLDCSMESGNGSSVLKEIADDAHTISMLEEIDHGLYRDLLEVAMGKALRTREQRVLRLRYGFEDGAEHTQSEIARRLKLSRQRVSQIELKALERLRRILDHPMF